MTEKDATARIAQLFNAFSSELVQIDARHIKLPHFTKVEVKETTGQKKFIAATFRGNSWLVQAYDEPVKENDIIEYIRNIKSSDYKIANKIIIPLAGMDENANLLAKELKLSIWGLATLNELLGFYGKIRMVAF